MRIMEAAPQVCRRHQFFVWTQGDLQRWLPHDLLLCGFYDREAKDLAFDVFNSRPLPEATVAQLQEVPPTWVQPLMAVWDAARQQAMTMSLGSHATQHEVLAALHGAGYSEVLMHGHTRPGRPDEVESFFVLARHGQRLSAQHGLALHLVEVERVGARKPISLDIRVLATSNRDLAGEVAAGRFREDLYYRLSVFPLAWRPLRERPADNPRITRLHHRGEYLQPEEAVEAGVPAFLPPLPEGVPSNRLGFAQWLAIGLPLVAVLMAQHLLM